MKKSIKILAILFIILLFTLNISLATEINMNLEPNDIFENDELVDYEDEEYDSSTSTTTSSTTISNVSSNSDTLGLTEILNILLIVVGVVLILLAIAILIRMNS